MLSSVMASRNQLRVNRSAEFLCSRTRDNRVGKAMILLFLQFNVTGYQTCNDGRIRFNYSASVFPAIITAHPVLFVHERED